MINSIKLFEQWLYEENDNLLGSVQKSLIDAGFIVKVIPSIQVKTGNFLCNVTLPSLLNELESIGLGPKNVFIDPANVANQKHITQRAEDYGIKNKISAYSSYLEKINKFEAEIKVSGAGYISINGQKVIDVKYQNLPNFGEYVKRKVIRDFGKSIVGNYLILNNNFQIPKTLPRFKLTQTEISSLGALSAKKEGPSTIGVSDTLCHGSVCSDSSIKWSQTVPEDYLKVLNVCPIYAELISPILLAGAYSNIEHDLNLTVTILRPGGLHISSRHWAIWVEIDSKFERNTVVTKFVGFRLYSTTSKKFTQVSNYEDLIKNMLNYEEDFALDLLNILKAHSYKVSL